MIPIPNPPLALVRRAIKATFLQGVAAIRLLRSHNWEHGDFGTRNILLRKTESKVRQVAFMTLSLCQIEAIETHTHASIGTDEHPHTPPIHTQHHHHYHYHLCHDPVLKRSWVTNWS